jgi:hypothetical protein
MGNPAGNQSLAMELVCAELGKQLGLYVPDFAIVELTEIQIPMEDHGNMSFGPAFASRSVSCITSDGSEALLERLSEPSDLALLIVFDTWIRNLDRCPPPDYLDPSPRRDNLCFTPSGGKLKLMAIDHSHCFVEGDLELEVGNPGIWADTRVYGFFPEFKAFLNEVSVARAIDRMALIDDNVIAAIVHSVPRLWVSSNDARNRWIDQIVRRKAVVGQCVMQTLVSQRRMDV